MSEEGTKMTNSEDRQFGAQDWINLSNYFVGNNYRFRENIIIPETYGHVRIKTNEEKTIEKVLESCPFKAVMSCVMG